MTSPPIPEDPPSPRTSSRIITLIAWVLLLAAWGWYTHTHDLTPAQTVARLAAFLSVSSWGIYFYIVIYFVRPVFLFPPTLLTMAAGYIFGPLPGIFYALLASRITALGGSDFLPSTCLAFKASIPAGVESQAVRDDRQGTENANGQDDKENSPVKLVHSNSFSGLLAAAGMNSVEKIRLRRN